MAYVSAATITEAWMRAIVFESFGGPEVLKEVPITCPSPGPGQILVHVKATSVNPIDIQTRRGDYADLTPLPGRLGVDVAGIVEQVGDGVINLRPGDEVFYVPRLLNNEGSYATHHVEDADIVAKKPANLTFQEAAALPLAAGTAWECLVERARIEPGERILVHGGAGGVGVYAVQIAHAAGAFVVATCRPENADFVLGLGADAVVDYRVPDLASRLMGVTAGRGFHVVMDTVGGKTIENSYGLLAEFGRVVTIVDHSTPQNLVRGWEKNASTHFVFTTQRRERLDRLRTLAERKLIRPIVEQIISLKNAAEAHRLSEVGGRRGKIVLTTDGL
jgi:NADPH:quinone reductase